MEVSDASRYSLADFHVGDSDDPLVPPAEYKEWRAAVTWATSHYERSLLGPPIPRTAIDVHGARRPIINLASYNYLGFAKHPETIAAAKAALDSHGTGACGSPILSGMTDLHRALERDLGAFLGRESTMLFNSGFGGALGALSGLMRKGDVAVIDSKAHISLIDGAKLSGATLLMFEHNDPRSLDQVLSKTQGKRRLVVVEGIYSMDGDVGDLPALLEVTEQHKVGMMIDEAHSILAMGARGRGVVEHFGVEDRVALQYATFSKAFAAVGGFVSGRAETLDYLRYYANSYGFSCALPPPVAGAVLKGLEVASRDDSLRVRLRENAEYFRKQLHALGLDTGTSTTHVVPIIIGANRSLLYMLSYAMLARGLFLAPVDFPSVPEDEVRFRASITAAHTRADLDEALNIIESTIVPALKAAP
ncbi:MAG: aminotransferase class I/II-fold pyridoxal phosphate-dependent enzyme [Polyangiaceae bacterium]|nr:aminotransferase class I/II-fold pyridoxal phosphate-dependent enzyme [Polyangiaceae bacterium]